MNEQLGTQRELAIRTKLKELLKYIVPSCRPEWADAPPQGHRTVVRQLGS
jgi:hypothetical protein